MNKSELAVASKNCVSVCVYDNDGPEGMFNRHLFPRSSDAVAFLVREYRTKKSRKDLNFCLENHWR